MRRGALVGLLLCAAHLLQGPCPHLSWQLTTQPHISLHPGALGGVTSLDVSLPAVFHCGVPATAHVSVLSPKPGNVEVVLNVGETAYKAKTDKKGIVSISGILIESAGRVSLRVQADGVSMEQDVIAIPGWMSLLPPFATLALSIVLKQVVVALLLGILTGAVMVHGGLLVGLLRTFDKYFVEAWVVDGHMQVLLFTFLLGGTIGVVQKSGGAQGLANSLKTFMGSKKQGELCALALGGLIFFDDYSSILIAGNSLRAVTKGVGVSVEKLAWIVHTVGVALASLSPISSWVGIQIGYVSGVIGVLELDKTAGMDGFVSVLASLSYRFFPLLALVMLVTVIVTGKDFGPMAEAEAALSPSTTTESAAAATAPGPCDPKPGTPLRSINALVPFGVVIAVTFGGMVVDGINTIQASEPPQAPLSLVNILSNCDSVAVLIWASSAGWLASLFLVLLQGILDLPEAMESWMEGMKDVLEPQFVLVLAWGLGTVVQEVQTAEYLAGALQSSDAVPPGLLPAIISCLCFLISYACGSTFGTMGIVFPLVGPLAWTMGGGDAELMNHCFGAILGSSIFGNVCSPISDTSILSCSATGCSLGQHVSTISPYIFIVGAISIFCCNLPVALGFYRSDAQAKLTQPNLAETMTQPDESILPPLTVHQWDC
ncbi:unnamed protein product [Chrysoparadoxa australica]